MTSSVTKDKIPIDINEDFSRLSFMLESHHALFYMMHNMGHPVLTDKIPTLAVTFDKEGGFINFLINPTFWATLNDHWKAFAISHECLHVILNHGKRASKKDNPRLANIAMDLVVNHMLIDGFGFDRNQLPNWEEYCWVETVFPKEKVPTDLMFEEYFNLLSQQKKETGKDTVDDHSGLSESSENWGDVIDKLNAGLSDEEKGAIRGEIEKHFSNDEESGQLAGTEAGGQWVFVDVGKVKKKKKWETVIKKWSTTALKVDLKDTEQWVRINRRFVNIARDFILPTEMETEENAEGRIRVWFFQDTSGSCRHLANRFFAAARSLPESRFDIKMHCFDTRVYETSLKTERLFGFGGTSFSCIESYIQNDIKKKNVKYPHAVFVITDGYGDPVHPQIPTTWHWFLSTAYKYCIPKESKTYMLSDFE